MIEYYQNDIIVRIDNDLSNEKAYSILGDEFPSGEYDTRLFYNMRNPAYLQLTIYYQHTAYLYEKFQTLLENGISILSLIKPKLAQSVYNSPDILDFSNSRLIEIEESHQWEHNKKPVILIIDNLDILYHHRTSIECAEFKLTINAFQHLSEYIKYSNLNRNIYDNIFLEDNRNKSTSFGPVRFILSFKHQHEHSNTIQSIIISRDAYLSLTDKTDKLSDIELINIGNSLCLLMSFYWEKTIDFFRAHIRVNNIDNYRTREILRFSDHYKDDAKNSILIKKFDTFYSLIECVNYSSFETNKEILSELIPRAIKSKNVDDISAFMILYNIIEKIRNYFLSKPVESEHFMIKEEFEFKLGKKKTNEFIKNKIKEIKEIVADSDLEEFDNKASDKVTFIKKTGLKEQIDSLLNYLKLNSEAYNIDLSNLIKIRNNIYHGKLPEEEINPYVEQMRILVYDLILKMIMT